MSASVQQPFVRRHEWWRVPSPMSRQRTERVAEQHDAPAVRREAGVVPVPLDDERADPVEHGALDPLPVRRLLVEEHVEDHLVGKLAEQRHRRERHARQPAGRVEQRGGARLVAQDAAEGGGDVRRGGAEAGGAADGAHEGDGALAGEGGRGGARQLGRPAERMAQPAAGERRLPRGGAGQGARLPGARGAQGEAAARGGAAARQAVRRQAAHGRASAARAGGGPAALAPRAGE
mmetsp:Transcript_36408/g.63975  ORF Transcript_36408/g.63975 Transcript_36408/m.63975 type:complete len:234 (-) Transcript_36408:100-801(-)